MYLPAAASWKLKGLGRLSMANISGEINGVGGGHKNWPGCAPLPLMVFGEAQVHRLIWQRLWDLRTNLNIGRDRPARFLPGVETAPDVAGRSETRVLRRLHRHGRALAEGAVKQEPLASRFG